MPLPEPVRGRVAALDLGEVRTGVALSDPERLIASPVAVVGPDELVETLRGLFEGEGVREVVVGVPKTMRGEVGFQAEKVLDKLDALRREFPGVRFVEWDERLTTRLAAAGVKRKRGGRGRRGGGPVDHLAAARMLQEYLGSRGTFEALRQE